jgi:FAD dependent oxidoreductase
MECIHSAQVVIIGAGVAGISAALKLAEDSKVLLLERKHLFWGSSGRNPGRMGHGFHYIDFDTAKMYLHASVAVQRNYPNFLIGKDLPFEHPIRHGRYFITKDSNYSFNEVMNTYRLLQAEYARLIEQDPKNEVFGPPEQFLRVLQVHEYADYINADIVQGAVETAEHLFNWPDFAKYIRNIIDSHPNIHLLENTEVIDIIARPHQDIRFCVATHQVLPDGSSSSLKINTNFIVNSSWENIDYLNERAGSRYIYRMRTNRLKCLLEVFLPESLCDKNSAFFCMGSFCMFSNMGDGRGMLTLADVTNMASSYTVKIDSNMDRYIKGEVSSEEKNAIAQEILTGVALYIPEMAKARIIDVKFGIVQTKGELNLSDLLDPKSTHHVRNYHGIREEYQGLISNPAMKLFYFLENAKEVHSFFHKQLNREPQHREVYRLLMESSHYPWNRLFRNDFKRMVPFIIDRMMIDESENPKEIAKQMSRTMFLKFDFNQYITMARQYARDSFENSPFKAVLKMILAHSKNPLLGFLSITALSTFQNTRKPFACYSNEEKKDHTLMKTGSLLTYSDRTWNSPKFVMTQKIKPISMFKPSSSHQLDFIFKQEDEARPKSVDIALLLSSDMGSPECKESNLLEEDFFSSKMKRMI